MFVGCWARWGLVIVLAGVAGGCSLAHRVTGGEEAPPPAAEAPAPPPEAPAPPPAAELPPPAELPPAAPAPAPEAPAAEAPAEAPAEMPAQPPAEAKPGGAPSFTLPPAIESFFEGEAEPPPPPPTAQPETYKVIVPEVDYAFVPHQVTIYEGDTVEWENHSPVLHQFATIPGSDPTGKMEIELTDLPPGQSVSHTFMTPGAYPYFCFIHNRMTGKIIVLPRQ
jgi:plastocyanin